MYFKRMRLSTQHRRATSKAVQLLPCHLSIHSFASYKPVGFGVGSWVILIIPDSWALGMRTLKMLLNIVSER